MDITYNDKVTVDGGSYIYSGGGEIVLNFGSITPEDPFNLEFDLQTNTTSNWNAPVEIIGISGFNIQNSSYSSYFKCFWGGVEHGMSTYPIKSEEYVHYRIWQQDGFIYIQITQSNGTSYRYNATYNGSFSTIHLGNYHKENRATGVLKNVVFATVSNYLDKKGLEQVWKNIKNYHKACMYDYYTKEEVDTLISNMAGVGIQEVYTYTRNMDDVASSNYVIEDDTETSIANYSTIEQAGDVDVL